MSVRDQIVSALFKELLGPRTGTQEVLDVDPRGEYLVGILEPADFFRGPLQYYSSIDMQLAETGVAEDDNIELLDTDPIEFGTRLDPRALPKSIGISFLIDASKDSHIDICTTWARYIQNDDNKWERVPDNFILRNIDIREDNKWSKNGVNIVLRKTIAQDGNYYVSIYVVNKNPIEKDAFPETEELIFQPQIRINCLEGTFLVPIRGEHFEDEEDASLSLLYKNKPTIARGHLCSALSKEVDPERPWIKNPNGSEDSSPFIWSDGELLSPRDKEYFTNPDVRSDFLPCYPIEQVKYKPPIQNIPDLKAIDLSEAWEPTILLENLEPISKAYSEWIKNQRDDVKPLQQPYQDIGVRHLNQCELSEERIRKGVELLKENYDLRLAFCFMNVVMDKQSIWKRNRPLIWRIFQIAFILQSLEGIVKENHQDRYICDVLWFPTGGGKTEAYLGLAVLSLAYRRRRDRNHSHGGAGTGVISRYTLRMLTIQQFRRALKVILACDYFRVINWRPKDYGGNDNDIWGTHRFSIGLWVGGEVTPNHLLDHKRFDRSRYRHEYFLGAIGRLKGPKTYRDRRIKVVSSTENEPAQILNCPACKSILAVASKANLPEGIHTIHWIIYSKNEIKVQNNIDGLVFKVQKINIYSLPSPDYYILSVTFSIDQRINDFDLDRWWDNYVFPALGEKVKSAFARASRPGYFIRKWDIYNEDVDFEIHCPNPSCELNQRQWTEYISGSEAQVYQTEILEPFSIPSEENTSWGIPISAYVIDEQVYHRCPSLIVATVDKFARLAYEPKAASIFGNVDKFDTCWGYYRSSIPPDRGGLNEGDIFPVTRFKPPELIIQDELHLIEGPLGSMVGLFETAIDELASYTEKEIKIKPKYVASSATIKKAESQVKAIFNRKVSVFPPSGVSIDDNFFSNSREVHPRDSENPGRLYLGVCSPGRGPHTPTIRIWTAILRKIYELREEYGSDDEEIDQFWTIVGYFNAIRELASASGLYKADMRERLRQTSMPYRPLEPALELSSRMQASEIPTALQQLSKFPNNLVDAVLATSMFGTGIDVDRLGLMIVHGQPKTSANYIQATGRVGRQRGGLVVTFYRATRPRDLDHYEFFIGYHRSLYRYVEPITVNPFSPRARDRVLGPLAVTLLRNAEKIKGNLVHDGWAPEEVYVRSTRKIPKSGSRIIRTRFNSPEIKSVISVIEERAQNQPEGRRPLQHLCKKEIQSELDNWKVAAQSEESLLYYESTMTKEPQNPVVLGDPQHEKANLLCVFTNAPQSLREVEGTARFEG